VPRLQNGRVGSWSSVTTKRSLQKSEAKEIRAEVSQKNVEWCSKPQLLIKTILVSKSLNQLYSTNNEIGNNGKLAVE
jgi:hypothetical protein